MAKTGLHKSKKKYEAKLQKAGGMYDLLARSDVQHEFGSDIKYRYAYSERQAEVLFRRAFPKRTILSVKEVL